MEMLKILTQKLKQQSLNEIQPFQASKVEEERDSGTESDEENAELEALEQAMYDEQRENQENVAAPGLGGRGLASCPLQIPSPPPRCLSPITYSIKKPLQLANTPAATKTSILSGLVVTERGDVHVVSARAASLQDSSDFDRCSLDYEPNSSTEFDRHSSEEELAVINCSGHELHVTTTREKRTWSQANCCSAGRMDSSGSSDEEVKDLLSRPQPLLFSSSPPKGVQRFSKTLTPRGLLLANVSSVLSASSVSPRKRYRHTTSIDVSDAPTVIQRPCLDFEKMQGYRQFFQVIEVNSGSLCNGS